MNILASYDWLKEYVDLDKIDPQSFASRVSLSGPGVERLYPQGVELDGIVVGHVVEVKPHPNADKLRIATVDIGSKKATIVCGGSNLVEDQWVAVAKVGSKVRWHGEGEPIELKPIEIRGEKSEGMICAANEIGLYDAFPHQEREIVDLGKSLPDLKVKAGTPLADALGLSGDMVLDIEITTNRPDAAGMVGLAREAAAILKRKLIWKASKMPKAKTISSIKVAEKKLCPRYIGVHIGDVTIGHSPWWLKRRLLSAGLRPINTAVDITNFVMLELGQPMHAFDADKLSEDTLVVRTAKKGEKMQALDGKTYSLEDGMLVIADADQPQAIAGIMGSETSAVTSGTTSIVLEAATFDSVSVRRTARKLNLYSDAQLRFEKGLSMMAPPEAMARAVELILELCGGKVTGMSDIVGHAYKAPSYSISFAKIDELIGIPMKKTDCVDTLKRLGFEVKADATKLTATVPWWRDHDIESGRDLVEEIARVYGYANLPAVFPPGIAPDAPVRTLALEDRAKELAKQAGYTETFTYSFTSRETQEMAGYDSSKLLSIANPLSADFELMRTSLLPSLLQVAMQNQERFRSQKLFELANVYYPRKGKLPDEQAEFGALVLGDENAWREAKGLVEHVLAGLGVTDIVWKRLASDSFWHPGRTVQAMVGEDLVATVGELHPTLAEKYKFEGRVALVDLPLRHVFHRATDAKRYRPIPIYPVSKRDLAILVDKSVEVQDVVSKLSKVDKLIRSVEWFDTYKGKGMPEGKKSLAFHIEIGADDRTLETADVDMVMEQVIEEAQNKFRADVRE
ncbi:phenylalanine--tRNA ligase subunit beta [Candidatus Uhrbacteria bacterium]|nr:phenylalanine--tRNA ligase subunit beta [Candidatus Uhrbacteria bacterium]